MYGRAEQGHIRHRSERIDLQGPLAGEGLGEQGGSMVMVATCWAGVGRRWWFVVVVMGRVI